MSTVPYQTVDEVPEGILVQEVKSVDNFGFDLKFIVRGENVIWRLGVGSHTNLSSLQYARDHFVPPFVPVEADD